MRKVITAEAANYLDKGCPVDEPIPYELIQYGQEVYAKVVVNPKDPKEIYIKTFVTKKFKGQIECAYIYPPVLIAIYPRTPEVHLHLILNGATVYTCEQYDDFLSM